MRRSCRLAALASLASSLAISIAPAARADKPTPPSERRDAYSPYERQTIERALKQRRGVVDPSPEGKIVEGIDVLSLDVFEDRDPLPAFLTPIANWFHSTTRSHVIEREVLLRPGERYDQALVDETARNLRGYDQISLVLAVPLRGGAPDRVRLLVITKDVWSLRLNSSYTFADGRLQYLLLQPSEENVLGTHHQILGNFVMDAAAIAVGGSYILPRLAGSRVNASFSASGIINRTTGRSEGSTGSFSYGQPLYSTRTTWSWGGGMSWDERISRRFIAGLPTDYDPAKGGCVIATAPPSGQANHQKCQYHRDVVSGSFGVTRSFGSTVKHDVSLSIGANRGVFRTLNLSGLTADQQKAYVADYVPVSDTTIGPSASYHTYGARFFDVVNLDTLGLAESYRRGHDVTLKVTPITTALQSSRNFVEVYAAAAFTWPIGDGLVRASLALDNELTTKGVPDGSFSASLRIATPRFRGGRLVFDAQILNRYANYLNAKSVLGGDTRLRGYPARMFIGQNVVNANLEYRSDPIEVMAVQFGWVIFADAGDAFDSFAALHLKQSAGFGMRAVFPQLQRSVMRVDIGFPLTPDALLTTQYHADMVVTFGQAF